MKKQLLFVSLLFPFFAANAQSSVAVTPVSATYTAAPPTGTFEVAWPAGSRNANERAKVWLMVDYRRVQNNAYSGGWLRAGAPATAAAITATAGTVSVEPGNDKGFWLQGPDDGLAFAATVTVPVTVDLSGYDDKFGWCGNATDRPPYVTEESGSYALHGAAPFILQTIPGDPAGTVSEATKAYAGCIYGLTDATNCPVESIPPMPSVSGFTASATTLCAGQSATLTATAANAQRYSFDDGATWQAGATKVVTPTTTTTYILKATRALGACTVSYATPVTITVHPSPELQFDNPPAALCANTDAVLTVNDLNSAAGSYCFRYECAGCVHNPYRSGNSAPAAAGCDWFPDCTYGAANTYSLSMYDAGSMTVWAKAKTDYGCVDSVATTITGTGLPAPTITLATANDRQTVAVNNAITPIEYITANASGATVTGLPVDVSGSWASNTYTISGTPSTVGTFVYTVSTVNDNSCSNQTVSGTLTVTLPMPPGAGTKTYTCGAQTWSEPVKVAACDKTSFTSSNSAPDCRSNTYNSIKDFYYNWAYVNANKNTMCPDPWHVPSNSEFSTLLGCLGTSSANGKYYPESSTWGGALAGYANGSSMYYLGSYGYYWSSTESGTSNAYCMYFSTSTANTDYATKYGGFQVRCVRDN
ncbi:MAG: hypothetical protein LBN98_02855 [Prevotellaceae bacterium]|jgi:uncharacterized protein (TIGR02145 family)|nr:hypothetical protein [Prevotellaceae bacterium]